MYKKMQNRRPHVSQIQKNHILKYLQKNPRLAYHKFSPSFSVSDARNEWKSLTSILNNLPGRGSVKTWKQWRKTWQDLKSKTKMKFLQGNDTLTREEKLIFKISGGFGDDTQLASNEVVKSETDESGIDSDDIESVTPSNANDKEQKNLGNRDTHENIFIHVVDDEPQNISWDSQVKTEYSAITQNTESEEEENKETFDAIATDAITEDQRSDRAEQDFAASYRETKLMFLRRIARADERSAIANERIADALERIALAGGSIF